MSTLTRQSSTGVDNIDIADKILITALIASLQDQKQTFTQNELLASDFSPTEEFSLRAIDQLSKAGLVKMVKSSSDPQPTYELMMPNNDKSLKELIDSLKGDFEKSKDKLKALIFDILSAECIEYVVNEMRKRNLRIKIDSKPPQRLLELLHDHTSAEVHMLLWQAMKNLNNSDFRILMATESHSEVIDQVIDEAYQHHERYQHFNRSIKTFKRSADYRRSAINKILFSHHLSYGPKYFTDLRY